jgi:hypothetical protein
MIYTAVDHESYLIAGPALEFATAVQGIGLELDRDFPEPLPTASDGEVAAVAVHAMTLLSDAMHAPNDTIKFSRVMTLFEFLASPDEYRNWKKLKGDIACHCAGTKAEYLKILERFKELTSVEDASGVQRGLRTLIVHHGRFIEEMLPDKKHRKALFHELQGYCLAVLSDMLDNRTLSWAQYEERRSELKKTPGVSTVS